MKIHASHRSRPAPNEPLWLVVRRDTRFSVFELRADGDSCICVGSGPTAAIRLTGVAPIAFTIERDTDGVWLVPGYVGAELRVDSQRIGKARLIYDRAVVEVADVRLILGIRDTPPTLRGGTTELDDATLSDRPKIDDSSLSSDTAPTIAIRRSSVVGLEAPLETASYSRADFVKIDPNIGDTREVPTMDFEGWQDSSEPEPRATQRQGFRRSSPIVEVFEPVATDSTKKASLISRSVSGGATSCDVTALSRPLPVSPVDSSATIEQPIFAPATTAYETVSEVPCLQPVSSVGADSGRMGKLSLLEQLGLLTKRHPAGVLGGAAVGSSFIVVFMVGAAHLLGVGSKSAAGISTSAKSVVVSTNTPRLTMASALRTGVPTILSVGSAAPVAPPTVASGTSVGKPTVAVAAGHLFAGRLPEAESAYRELGTNYPNTPSYAVLARVLGRRNGADCRSAFEIKKRCPVVKQ